MGELIDKIELVLISEGQQDTKFQWGEKIRYTPHEVAEILKKHADELVITFGRPIYVSKSNHK